VKLKPAQKNWYRVATCLHEFGQRLVAPRLQILEIFRVIGAESHHHGKVADLCGDTDTHTSSSSSTTVGSMPVGVWRHFYYRCPPLPI